MHLAVAAAVAVATAVLTGALVVGDTVRGSLRDLTLERLGRIDRAMVTPRFFRAELASEVSETDGFATHFASAHPALLLRGSATLRDGDKTRRASDLRLIGVTDDFWKLGGRDPRSKPDAKGVWLTEAVARELEVTVGDEILVRVPLPSDVPADSPLGEKADIVVGRRFPVAGVLPDDSLARFDIQPSQRPPRSVFFALDELAEAMDETGKANLLLLASDSVTSATGQAADEWLGENFRPDLSDYGLSLTKLQQPARGGFQIASDGLVLRGRVLRAAERAFGVDNLQPITTYLANTMKLGNRQVPYSTVAGVDSRIGMGPLFDADGNPTAIAEHEIVLNDWTATELGAKVGDTITLTYYEPESTHGELVIHQPPLELTVKAIVPLKAADGTATSAADPHLTPQLPGVTDQESISDWDLPFELVEPINQKDEDYWDEYSTTPKAFVSHALARRIWATRWGRVSLMRVDAPAEQSVEELSQQLRAELSPSELGLTFLPVKQQGLDAASGTTPFDGLFLGFSMFLIAAAVMLLVLLFRLAMEGRAREMGLLSAIGFTSSRSIQLLSREALLVALLGSVAGMALGIAYAAAMIWALTTLWVDAIAAPFLELHVGPWSLPIGFAIGMVISWWTIRRTLRQLVAQPPRGLLAGSIDESLPLESTEQSSRFSFARRWCEAALVAAIAVGVLGTMLQGEAQAGAFFGVGALVLAGVLGLFHRYCWHLASRRSAVGKLSLFSLAVENLSRRPPRSTLTVGLVASASFLLLAISAFRLAPSDEGTGGFDWYATSDQPLHYDLETSDGRYELGIDDQLDSRLAGCQIASFRAQGGEDASCLNLYRTQQPRVIGVRDFQNVLGGFAWSTTVTTGDAQTPDLNADLGTSADDSAALGRRIVPVVLDFNTAMYSLHLSGTTGDRLTIRDESDQSIELEVVGLLKNSVLQGDLIVSDENFRKIFPSNSGSKLFLIREGATKSSSNTDGRSKVNVNVDAKGPVDVDVNVKSGSDHVESTLGEQLEGRLDDYGFDATPAVDRLASFLAVQNTYLSTFQSLGGLGLLLGTIGLAVVQLRSVIERQGELALLQAVGFPRKRVAWLVLLETLVLLAAGLLLGALAAVLALLPQLGQQQAAVPLETIAWLLGTITLVGTTASWLATRFALRRPILPSLRGE